MPQCLLRPQSLPFCPLHVCEKSTVDESKFHLQRSKGKTFCLILECERKLDCSLRERLSSASEKCVATCCLLHKWAFQIRNTLLVNQIFKSEITMMHHGMITMMHHQTSEENACVTSKYSNCGKFDVSLRFGMPPFSKTNLSRIGTLIFVSFWGAFQTHGRRTALVIVSIFY